MLTAEQWIEKLQLIPHPEGGFYRETYRSGERFPKSALPKRFPADRNFSTAIYYLLKGKQCSKFHRVLSDEMWHFYAGTTLLIYVLTQKGELKIHRLGNNLDQNETPQFVVPFGEWFSARVEDPTSYALTGCTLAPGFDFDDFEIADTEKLIKQYPLHQEIIHQFSS